LRRLVLMLVTALIVARPVVLGEDPGMLSDLTDPGGLVLTLLWMVAAISWAAWRLWSGQGDWYGGGVGLALLVVVALVFVSAESAAPYRHPARLIAWEWLGLLLAFFLVRQLAVSPGERQGLFAAFVAGAIALSAHAVYQAVVEFPMQEELANKPDELRRKIGKPWAEANDAELEQMRQRMRQNNVFATYAHPNSFAGYLALLLPALVGTMAVCRRDPLSLWRTYLAGACAVLGLVGLWLTHSRGALGALVVVALVLAGLRWRRLLLAHKRFAVVGALLLFAASLWLVFSGALNTALGKKSSTAAFRLEYWRTTVKSIEERPLLGVGPGNFGPAYTRHMDAAAGEKIKDPHNFLLEMWATSGVFAMAALLAAFGAFFVLIGRSERRKEEGGRTNQNMSDSSFRDELPWDFYVGGMIGLLLGFVLRAWYLEPDEIVGEALTAGLRSVVWFAAFALLDRAPWTDRDRVVALTAGVAALLLNLCVSGGISSPSVAGPLWVAVALALNSLSSKPSTWFGSQRWSLNLPLPVMAATALIYLAYVFYPVASAASDSWKAAHADRALRADLAKKPEDRTIKAAFTYLHRGVIQPLEKAFQEDPENARTAVHLAWAYRELWVFGQRLGMGTRATEEAATKAAWFAGQAELLDPAGREGYDATYTLRMNFGAAKTRENKPEAAKEARQQYQLAVQALERFLPQDPTDAHLRFQLAAALTAAGDKEEAARQAEEALRLDEVSTWPTRQLTASQRELARQWRSSAPPAR
jgi:tetratricopeptide (TPR) repeat protein